MRHNRKKRSKKERRVRFISLLMVGIFLFSIIMTLFITLINFYMH